MQTMPSAFNEMARYNQWVVWFAAPNPEKAGKFNKFPCDWRTGEVVGSVNPDTWTDYATAMSYAKTYDRGHGAGIGFVFTASDPFYFLDIDGCLSPEGVWSTTAIDLCNRLAGAAIEVSHSGKGLHIIGTVTKPIAHSTRNTSLGLELYTDKRFVALTGLHAQGDSSVNCDGPLSTVISDFFPTVTRSSQNSVTRSSQNSFNWTTAPVPEWSGPDDDMELLRVAMAAGTKSAKAAFGGGVTFKQLWDGEIDPTQQSESDQSLANHLAYWTGKNCERIERLMRISGLMREKWDSPNHLGYLRGTIIKACQFVSGVLSAKPKAKTVNESEDEEAPALGSNGFIPAHVLNKYFQGCFYVTKRKETFILSRDELVSSSVFDVIFGGHSFMLDGQGTTKTKSAFEAFYNNQVHKPAIVRDLLFRPELEPGAVIQDGRFNYVNSYVPYECPSEPGDVSLFLNHLEKLLPIPRDRELFTHYMASMVQNPGKKFQWWPVLQGVEGNGKTLIIAAMTYIIGEHFTHLPNAASMVKDGLKFNSWIDRKLFIGVEEINVSPNRDFLDEFKTIVTNRRIPSEGKGTNQTNIDNRANGILMTNVKNGVPVKRDGRRYAIFYTAQQHEQDLQDCGMNSAYFNRLWGWFDRGGAANIAHYLKNYSLKAEMDPAQGLIRAPATSSTEEALNFSLGVIEQEVMDAIEEGKSGFAGGWVSTTALDRLMESKRFKLSRVKRKELLAELGYYVHEGLSDGRVNNVVMPDNGRPILYIKKGHRDSKLTVAKEIEAAYQKAQNPGNRANNVVILNR